MTGESDKYWYNLVTGEVEHGLVTPSVDRAGPFDTAEQAARAPEIIRERSRAWAEEDRRENESRPAVKDATRQDSPENEQN